MFQLKWNAGVHNYMTYITGDIRVGAINPPLSNIGIGRARVDDPVAAKPISIRRPATSFLACSASPTIQEIQPLSIRAASTMHFDWGASQSCRSRSWLASWAMSIRSSAATAVQATVSAASSPRWLHRSPIGFLFPVGDMQGYLNLKAYGEVRCEKPASRLEYLGDLLYLAARARSASDDEANRQKILASTRWGSRQTRRKPFSQHRTQD